MTVIDIERPDSATRRAVRDTAPFAIALIPFGAAVGGASAAAGFSAWESVFGGVALLAGASQLAAIEVIGAGGGIAPTEFFFLNGRTLTPQCQITFFAASL